MHDDDDHHPHLLDLAATQLGMVERSQLRELGFTPNTWTRMVRSDRWTQVAEHVVRLRGAPATRGDRVLAAILDAGGDTVLSYQAGAAWWGVPGFALVPPELCRTGSSTRSTPLARIHRIRSLPSGWTTTLHGVPVARPELIALHLCATIHPERAARALDNLWRDGLLDWRSVARFLGEMGERGRNGTALLRQLLDARPIDHVPPASNLEARASEVLAPLGLRLRRQIDLGGDRWGGRVDLYDSVLPLVIEVQSEKYHSALLDVTADAARRVLLESGGFTVVEVTDIELWTRPHVALDRVRAARAQLLLGHRAG